MDPDAADSPTYATELAAPRTQGPALPAPDEATRYDLGPLLGRGGMAEVRLARDTRIDREVAVKLMRPELRGTGSVARFFREARVQGALDHPAVVPVHDLGIDATGAPYFVMKRVAGVTLADVLAGARTGARTPSRRELVDLLVDVCLAIELAHQRGIVHRDLKPANIMLGDFGETYVLDWGIAKVQSEHAIQHVSVLPGETSPPGAGATQHGDLLGTPGYMAPEQARGEAISAHADVFSLGCILFEVLAGAPALPAGLAGIGATLAAEHHSPAEAAPSADVPPELDALCRAATAADPATRPTARALADGLRAYLDGDRDLAARKLLANAHARAAREAARTAATSDTARARATSEAARALVLDRENPDAQELLATLVLEAPHRIPAEALADADRARAQLRQRGLRGAAIAYGLLALLLGSLFLFGVRAPAVVVVSIALSAGISIGAGLAARRLLPSGSPWFWGLMIANGTLLAVGGLLTGPVVIAPIFVIGSLAALLGASPLGVPAWTVVASHLLPIVIDFTLELTGLTPRTFAFTGHGVTLEPWAVDFTPLAMTVVFCLALATQVANTVASSLTARREEEAVRNRLHAQSWHLRQLDPRRPSRDA